MIEQIPDVNECSLLGFWLGMTFIWILAACLLLAPFGAFVVWGIGGHWNWPLMALGAAMAAVLVWAAFLVDVYLIWDGVD